MGRGESDLPACGPPANFSVHMASSAVTPVGSVHTSSGDNVVCMWCVCGCSSRGETELLMYGGGVRRILLFPLVA